MSRFLRGSTGGALANQKKLKTEYRDVAQFDSAEEKSAECGVCGEVAGGGSMKKKKN